MEIFFRKIKENCGILDPSWVMSDLAPQYYTAFTVVNDCSPKRLLCTWHLDKAWKEELNKKVSDVAVQADVYKMLRVLLEERNQIEFEDKLKIFIDRLNQGGTQIASFLAYFQSYWLKKVQEWAYCFRIGTGINTNMFVEAFHRVFRHKYLKSKVNTHVDTCLFQLMKFNRDTRHSTE